MSVMGYLQAPGDGLLMQVSDVWIGSWLSQCKV